MNKPDFIKPVVRQPRIERAPPTGALRSHTRSRRAVDPHNHPLWLLSVLFCSIAIASVPIFSRTVGLSFIPQLLASGAVVMAGLCCIAFNQFPRMHPAIISFVLLVVLWAFTIPADPIERAQYMSLVKLTALSLAVHALVRLPRHLLVLLGFFAISGAVALMLNWAEIRELRYVVESGEADADTARLSGSFTNANTAGVFAAFAALSSLIVFFNTRHYFRWLVLVSGLSSGLIIGGLTGSRTGMLGLLISGLSIPAIALAGKRGDVISKWLKGMVILGVAGTVALLTLVQLPQFERLTRLTQGREADASADTRWQMAVESVEVWLQYPIAGAGFQGFQKVSRFEGYSHTTFGEILANAGLIGAILISVFYFLPGIQLMHITRGNYSPKTRRLAVALLVFNGVFIIVSIFAVMHIRRDAIPIWAAICGVIHQQIALRKLRPHRSVPSNLGYGFGGGKASSNTKAPTKVDVKE